MTIKSKTDVDQRCLPNRLVRRWVGGERVTRKVFMDDGTWRREGDKCLSRSPLRHGKVMRRCASRGDTVLVQWDDGSMGRHLDHGIDREISLPDTEDVDVSRKEDNVGM